MKSATQILNEHGIAVIDDRFNTQLLHAMEEYKNQFMIQQTYGEWMRSNPPVPTMTAVEWLVKELNLEGYDYTIQQAKAMEKEQIEDAVNQHYVIPSNYYHKTYGKDQ